MDKQLKIIGGIGLGIVVLGALLFYAQPDTNTPANNPLDKEKSALTVEEANNYDFGTISMKDGKVKHAFKIKNTNTEAVTITKMYTSCMCTTASLMAGDKQFGPFGMIGHGFISKIDQTLNPNEEATVEVVYDPAAHGPSGVGRTQRMIIIENTASQPVELLIAVNVTP